MCMGADLHIFDPCMFLDQFADVASQGGVCLLIADPHLAILRPLQGKTHNQQGRS